MASGHARVYYALGIDGRTFYVAIFGDQIIDVARADLTDEEAEKLPRYDYYFGQYAPETLPSDTAIDALAKAMVSDCRPESEDSDIPAGYSYLGQLIIHDITWILLDGEEKANRASAALDFDSVLGNSLAQAEPAGPCSAVGPLRVGLTAGGWAGERAVPEDVPRKPKCGAVSDDDKNPAGFPLIPDTRNEGFLQLAQTHVAFLKFYNAIARRFGYGESEFDEPAAKRCFILHSQWVVLHDFLEKLVDPDIYCEILNSGCRRAVHPDRITDEITFLMPLEFAAAAGRYGHSMIRSDYNWNSGHSNAKKASLEELIDQSHQNGNPGHPKLQMIPYDWVIDWQRFYDFRPPYGEGIIAPVMAKKIDTRLTQSLRELPEYIRDVPKGAKPPPEGSKFNLARETLYRQLQFRMASAQAVIATINTRAKATVVTMLTESEWQTGNDPAIDGVLQQFSELKQRTPIWFYVLKEAERRGRCGRLGPLGSRLVMETIHAAIEASAISILREKGWKPELPSHSPGKFTMTDLLTVAKGA